VDQVMTDAQTSARGMIDRVTHPVLGEIPVVSTPVKFSNMKVGVRAPAPVRGQHTDEVLASLGYGADAIAGLRARKVVA
jgi:formyl-CoA transferase